MSAITTYLSLKKHLIFLIILYLFFGGSVRCRAQNGKVYRTLKDSSVFSDLNCWQFWDDSIWRKVIRTPGLQDDVYIQSGHILFIDSELSVKNIFISSGTVSATSGKDAQIDLVNNTFNCYGKLSCYFGEVDTITNSKNPLDINFTTLTPSLPLIKKDTGSLKFRGSTRVLFEAGEWGAGAKGSQDLFNLEFDLNSGDTGFILGSVKAANWIVHKGILYTDQRVAIDNGNSGEGDFILEKDAVFISLKSGNASSSVISRTGSSICGKVFLKGRMVLLGLSPYIQAKQIFLDKSSSIEYSRQGNQNFINAGITGAYLLTDYYNLVLGNSGNKNTVNNQNLKILEKGSLHLTGGKLVLDNTGTFEVSPDSTTIVFSDTIHQIADSISWDTGFANVILDNVNGLSLNFKRSVKNCLHLRNGTFQGGKYLGICNNAIIHIENGSLQSAPDFKGLVDLHYLNAMNTTLTGAEIPGRTNSIHTFSINNSKGVKLRDSCFVSGNLILKNGILFTSDSGLIVLSSSAKSDSGHDLSHICGPVIKTGSNKFLFPVGSGNWWAGTEYQPRDTSKSYTMKVTYRDSAPEHRDSLSGSMSGGLISNREFWKIEREISYPGKFGLFWKDGARSGISSLGKNDLIVACYDSGFWKNGGNNFVSGSATNGFILSETLNNAELISFGSPSAKNALPVQLKNFKVVKDVSGELFLEWSTFSELNCKHFEIQKVNEKESFETVDSVCSKAVNGTGTNQLVYRYKPDLGKQKIAFYRLKQVDFNGSYSFSEPVKVKQNGIQEFKWFLSEGSLNFEKPLNMNSLTVYLIDPNGRLTEIYIRGEQEKFPMNEYQTGAYYLWYSNGFLGKLLWINNN
ncbi:MAG: hypothetical protein H6605_10495 [Flavobacteriales bacterium]|nr:hypothetical protein [Flavobacteriales bacterium]